MPWLAHRARARALRAVWLAATRLQRHKVSSRPSMAHGAVSNEPARHDVLEQVQHPIRTSTATGLR